MKLFRIFVLALFSVVLLASCAPTASSNTSEDSVAPVTLGTSSAILHGILVQYRLMDKVIYHDDSIGTQGQQVSIWSDWTGDSCIIQISESTRIALSRDSDLARTLATHVAYCFNAGPLNKKYTDEESYRKAYGQAYIAKCGNKLEPLGWMDASDGQCELPEPTL